MAGLVRAVGGACPGKKSIQSDQDNVFVRVRNCLYILSHPTTHIFRVRYVWYTNIGIWSLIPEPDLNECTLINAKKSSNSRVTTTFRTAHEMMPQRVDMFGKRASLVEEPLLPQPTNLQLTPEHSTLQPLLPPPTNSFVFRREAFDPQNREICCFHDDLMSFNKKQSHYIAGMKTGWAFMLAEYYL